MNWRSSLHLPVLSVFCGILLFFVFRFFALSETPPAESGTSYAALAVSEPRGEVSPEREAAGGSPSGIPEDRPVREALEHLGIEGIISESTQQIPVDDFGVLKMVALDTFYDEIESFDPRDSGYAEKLKTFFARDGRRFFFIPLDNELNTPAKLRKIPAALKGDYSSELIFPGRGKPFLWYFALLAAALAAACVLSRCRKLFIHELPVLFSFGWGGFPAILLAGILAGIWELLREPLRELSVSGSSGRGAFDYAGAGWKGALERLKPFRKNISAAVVFLAFFPALSLASGLPLFPVILGAALFFAVCFLSFREETRRALKNRHILFTPVILFPRAVRTFSLVPVLPPFGAAAFISLFLPLALSGFSPSSAAAALADARYIVSSVDYSRYIAFQRSFSYLPLGSPENIPAGNAEEDFFRYRLGADGLITSDPETSANFAESGSGRLNQGSGGEAPVFPLEKLMEFLVQYSKAPGSLSRERGDLFAAPGQWLTALGSALIKPKLWIAVVMIFTVCVFNLFRPGMNRKKKKRIPALRDKRIAA